MCAAVPCYNLRKLHRALEGQLPPISRGLMAAWREILGINPLQARDPGCQHVYQLPGPVAT